MTMPARLAAWASLALLGACATGSPPAASSAPALPPAAHYVAMGSSFAAGPGITASADTPANRCARSADNYAHQLARRRGLVLADVSCSGATTAHLLGAWRELPPQLDALTPDTRLVTLTIGGNDVGYAGGLVSASCPDATRACRPFRTPDEAAWPALESRLDTFAREVRRRAPLARLVFVNYVTILPAGRTCAAAPMPAAEADKARALAARLAALTATVARRHDAGLIDAAALSRDHDACARVPWVTGIARARVTDPPYHPNLAGMTAIADALDHELAASRGHRRPS